jgi:hypothetical protein
MVVIKSPDVLIIIIIIRYIFLKVQIDDYFEMDGKLLFPAIFLM